MEREESDQSGKSEDVLPFCLVLIWPKDADENSTLQEVVRVFEEKDQRLFQISQQTREKVFHREDMVSDWISLKRNYLYTLNRSVDDKRNLLNALYMALEQLSLPNASSNNQEKLQNHKLNSRMLHKTKTLAQEKQLLREVNENQKRENASTSPLKQTSDIISVIHWKHKYWYVCRDSLKISDKPFGDKWKNIQVTREITQGLKQAIRNKVKMTSDELMELGKKKKPLDIKRRKLEEEIEAANEEIWSFQKHLKEKHNRKEACLFLLRGSQTDPYWFLKHWNLHLEYESLYHSGICRKKSFLKKLLK